MDNNINIVSISNIELEPYFLREAEKSFWKYGKKVSVVYIQYKECTEERYKETVKNADIILAVLNFEVLYPDFFNAMCAEKYTNEKIKNDAV